MDDDSAVCHDITALEVIVEAVVRPFYLGITLMFASLNLAQGIPLNSVCTGSLRIRLEIIYRPPYSTNHPVTVNSFIDVFSEYLESVILSNDLLYLTGDFNIHVDDHNDPAASCFLDLLESMSLTEQVAEPTHEYGHTLDLVITRESDNLICGRPAPDILFPDHLALLFKLKTARPPLKVGCV